MKKLTFNTIEPFIFFSVLLLNLIPIFSGKFFPTMDGAAHLNNATIIKELLINGSSPLGEAFKFNSELVPNWIGHFILVVLKFFLPSYLAEKILILIYFIGMPIAFRELIRVISPNNILYSFFIFPFTYSSLFLFGFYNFSFGIILFLITTTYWLKVYKTNLQHKEVLILFVLITITYFSHIFLFAILLMTIAIHTVIYFLSEYIEKPEDIKMCFLRFLKVTLQLILASIIPLALFIIYILSRNSFQNENQVQVTELIAWIKNIKPLIAYNPPLEEAFTTKIFYAIAILIFIGCYTEINKFLSVTTKNKQLLKQFFVLKISWFVVVTVLLLMYFFLDLADDGDSGGFFKVRVGLLLFILLVAWASTFEVSKWMSILSIFVVLYMNQKLNSYYSSVIKELDFHAQECYEISKKIPAYSVVLPIDVSGHWLKGHFSNYLGADNPLIILENYECSKEYFPLVWNNSSIPNYMINGKSAGEIPCLWWKSNTNNSKKEIDYIFVLGDINSTSDNCLKEILVNIDIVYQSPQSTLLKISK